MKTRKDRLALKMTVGIEIEVSGQSLTPVTPAQERLLDFASYTGRIVNLPENTNIRFKTDASCGYEVNTDILRTLPKLRTSLKHTLGFLGQMKAAVNNYCGLHIHVGKKGGYTARDKERLTRFFLAMNRRLFFFAPPHRARNGYCQGHDPRAIRQEVKPDRGRVVNLTFAKGTVEFRFMASVLDAEHIEDYAIWLSHLCYDVINSPIEEFCPDASAGHLTGAGWMANAFKFLGYSRSSTDPRKKQLFALTNKLLKRYSDISVYTYRNKQQLPTYHKAAALRGLHEKKT